MNERNYPSVVVLMILFMSLLTSVLVPYDLLGVTEIPDNEYQVKFTTSYTPHDPIVIKSNSDFVSQGWVGNGTMNEPYLIQNLSITNQSDCVLISNTNVYFEISYCLISAPDEMIGNAIRFENVTHGTVKDCMIEKHNYLFTLYSSSNCTLIYNTATTGFWGYYLVNSSSVALINNTASDCQYGFTSYLSSCIMINNTARDNDRGFHLYEASFCNLTDNLAHNNLYGFHLFYSNSCSLVNNTSYENRASDFSLSESSSCTLKENSGWGKGLYITGPSISHWIHDISGNTVRNLSIGYLKSISSLTINGGEYGQLVLANCSFVTLKNGIFNSVVSFVRLGFCTNCTLTNNTVMNSDYGGFSLWNSPMCILSNNTATNNRFSGFQTSSSPNCTLINNTATSNGMYAFYFSNSSTCTLTNNNAINHSLAGYHLRNSTYCILTNNTAYDSSIGFELLFSDSCVLTSNTASENYNGIYLFATGSCILTKNIAMNNIRGISLSIDCTDNLLFLNLLFSNSEYNGIDDGFSNSWDNGTHGNYWDDWDCTGVYSVPGSAGNVDNHPYFYGVIPPDNPITSTTTTTTTTVGEPGSLVELLIAGISVVSATVIGVVLLMTIRAKRDAHTSV